MIDFTTSQLSWIIVGALSMGGTGYMSMTSKVDALDTKLAVTINNSEHANKSMESFQQQLNRIEQKLDSPARK
jgi:hypothetical protein